MFVNQPSFSWAHLFLCNTLACNCWPKLTVWFISAITPNAADWAGTCSDLWFIAGGGCTKYFATTSHEQLSSHTSISISSLCVSLLSRVQLFATPWIVAYEAPPSMGFSRQEYWSFSFNISPSNELEWVSFPFSRGSSQPRDRTQVSLIPGRCFNLWAMREALSKDI